MYRRITSGGLVLCFALLTLLAPSASAQQDPAEQIAAIELQSRRSTSGARVVPVEVSLLARRALEGDLLIEAQVAGVNWNLPVQVAANTEATQMIIVPVSFNEVDLKATLRIDGENVVEQELRIFDGGGPMNAVGLVGIDAPAATVPLSPPVGDASLVELNDLSILGGLDTVVASPAGLRALSPDEQAILLTWVSAGRQLVVADRAGTIDTLLPPEWQSEHHSVLAGAGLIRYSGQDWADRVPPGPGLSTDPSLLTGFGQLPHTELLNDAGFRIPGLGIIALILGVYLLVAGPITFAVLAARGRQTLTWVVLPGLAVLFTAGVFVVGGFLTSGRGNGHATIAEISPVGTALTDTVLIADSGTQTVELPVGWSLSASGLNSTSGNLGSPVIIEPTAGADRLIFEIDAGSGGTAILHGRTDSLNEALQISDIVATDEEVTGQVLNASGQDLSNVIAMVGRRLAEVGDLASGAQASFSIDMSRRARDQVPEIRAWDLDDRFFFGFEFDVVGPGFGGRGGGGGGDVSDAVADGPINGSAWIDWRASRMGSSTPSGIVTAVGWTRDISESLLDGRGRIALVARQPILDTAGPIHPDLIREVPVSVFNPFGPEPFNAGPDGPGETIQYIRQPGANTSNVAIEVGEGTTELQVWAGDDWRSFRIAEFGRVVLAVPEEAWIDDVMWLKASTFGFFGDPNATNLALVPSTNATVEVPLLPPGERFQREGFGEEFPPEEIPVELAEVFTVELDEAGNFEGESTIFNSYDVWEVALSEGDVITVTMDGFNEGSLDSFLVLVDPDGRQVAENDDFGRGLDSQVRVTAEATGVYRIETRPLYNGSNGDYAVIIEVEFADGGET